MAPPGVKVGVSGMDVEEAAWIGVAVWVGTGEDMGVTGKDPPEDAHPVRLIITTRIENNKVDFIIFSPWSHLAITDLAIPARCRPGPCQDLPVRFFGGFIFPRQASSLLLSSPIFR